MSTVLMPSGGRPLAFGRSSSRSIWTGAASLSLASFGVVIGLGSAWRLPALLDQYGGAAFLLAYFAVLLIVGLPLLMAELMIGRRGRANPRGCYDRIAREEGRPCRWRWVAAVGGVAGVLLLAAGSELAAQALVLFGRLVPIVLTGTADSALSTTVLSHTPIMLAGRIGFFAVIGLVAAAGAGTRARTEVLVIGLAIALLIFLAVDLFSTDFTATGLRQLLRPHFARLGLEGIAEATRLALLTLGLTVGTVTAHGAALPGSRSILRTATLLLGLAGSAVAVVLILVATALHPYRIPPLEGSSLLLGQMPAVLASRAELGRTMAWYGLVALAGVGGGLAVLHSVVEQLLGKYRWERKGAVLYAVLGAGFLSGMAALAGPQWGTVALMRTLASDLLVPGATLGLAIFAGWAMSRRATRSELGMGRPAEFLLWRALIRYIAPAVLSIVLAAGAARLVAG